MRDVQIQFVNGNWFILMNSTYSKMVSVSELISTVNKNKLNIINRSCLVAKYQQQLWDFHNDK